MYDHDHRRKTFGVGRDCYDDAFSILTRNHEMNDQSGAHSKTTAQQHADSAKRPFNSDGGEDEVSTSHDGNDDHLHDDQKPITGSIDGSDAGNVDKNDPKKTEKLTKAGRDIDPDAGTD